MTFQIERKHTTHDKGIGVGRIIINDYFVGGLIITLKNSITIED